jgi:DNA repair ATPase RecN
MKYIVMSCLFLSSNFVCLSQASPADTTNELNGLKNMKLKLSDKVKELQVSIDQLQPMLDSVTRKLDNIKATMTTQKKIAEKQHSNINHQYQTVKKLEKQLNAISRNQDNKKKIIKQSSNLLMEIDSRINELTKKHND